MRVQAFRVWFTSAVQQGIGAARRAGLAVSRGIRRAVGQIEVNVGVGDDESRFGQSGSRAWMQIVDEAREKLLQLFENSYFERRFPRFEKFVKRVLGRPVRLEQNAPKLEAPKKKGPTGPLGAHTAAPGSAEEARLRQQIKMGMMQAHTGERAGIRDRVETHRRGGDGEPGDHS